VLKSLQINLELLYINVVRFSCLPLKSCDIVHWEVLSPKQWPKSTTHAPNQSCQDLDFERSKGRWNSPFSKCL